MTEADFEMLFENMLSPFSYYQMVYDENGRPIDYIFLAVNAAFETETGMKKEQVIGKNVLSVFPLTEAYWIEILGEVASTGVPAQYQNFAAALGNWYETKIYSPKRGYFAMTVNNITEVVKNRDALGAANRELQDRNAQLDKSVALLTAIIESSPQVEIYALDTALRYVSFNHKHWHAIKTLFGNEVAIGKSILETFQASGLAEEAYADFTKVLNGENIQKIVVTPAGRYLQHFESPIIATDGSIIGLTCLVLDISEQKTAEQGILYLSYHDKLTGLYNRRFYEEEIKRMDREQNYPMTILVGDVNGLKLVNDVFGHAKGDELLVRAADAIQLACRSSDVVARWGGDEFVVLLPNTNDREAEKIVKRIRETYHVEDICSLSIHIAFGWATKADDSEDITNALKRAENHMYKCKIIENANTKGSAINTIINTLHEKNPREEMHSKRVSEICQQIGSSIGLTEYECTQLKVVGLLHDIGKIGIEEGILNKTGPLSEQEFEEVKRHPDIGFRIIRSSYEMTEIADDLLAHHERWDGCGYPKNLKGEEIPLMARIIAIADAYDAMSSDRPYRKAMEHDAVVAEIRRCSGSQFDPALAEIFVQKVLAIDHA